MSEKQIILVGVGHTNAHILHRWRRSPIAGARLVCISSFPVATYSGMLPGSLTGQYASQKMEIDLVSLARAARADLLIEPARGVDLTARTVQLERSGPVPYDVLSVGVGSTPDVSRVEVTGGSFVPIKPMQTFLMRLYERLRLVASRRRQDVIRVLVAGGGVGGIEVSFCLPSYLQRVAGGHSYAVSLVDARDRIGRGLSSRAVDKTEKLLRRRAVNVVTGRTVQHVSEEAVCLDNGDRLDADIVVWAAGGVPPPLLAAIELPKDPAGFLLTDDNLRSTGAGNVFAVGDTGTIQGGHEAKAGVYAVRQGPILFENIRAVLRDRPLHAYAPQSDFLRLLNTGDGKALLDYKSWAIHARWCWRLKDWIDRRFVSRFRVTRTRF